MSLSPGIKAAERPAEVSSTTVEPQEQEEQQQQEENLGETQHQQIQDEQTVTISVPNTGGEEIQEQKDVHLQTAGKVNTTFNLEDFPVYSDTKLSFNEAAHLILNPEDLDDTKVCHQMPPGCPGIGNFAFIVDTTAMLDVHDVSVDEHGSWGKPSSRSQYYILSSITGKYEKVGERKAPDDESWDVKLMQLEYWHPGYPKGKFSRSTVIARDTFGDPLQWAVIQYASKISPRAVPVKPHRNSRYSVTPYQRTKPSTLRRMEAEAAVRGYGARSVFDSISTDLMDAGSRYKSDFPRNIKQAGYATKRAKAAGLGLTSSSGSSLMKRMKTEHANPRVAALQEAVARLEKEKLERELEVLEIQKQYYSMKLAREERTHWIQTPNGTQDTEAVVDYAQEGDQFQLENQPIEVDQDSFLMSDRALEDQTNTGVVRPTQYFSAGRSGRRVRVVYPPMSTNQVNIS